MKFYRVEIKSISTGETIYTEESNKASDLKFYVEQVMSNNCYVVIREPEKQSIKTINFTELLKNHTK